MINILWEEVYFNTVCFEICAYAAHWLFIYFKFYSFNAREQISSTILKSGDS